MKENPLLIWPGKNILSIETERPDTRRDFIFPNPLTEKTLFLPEIQERIKNQGFMNRIFHGDNLEFMEILIEEGYENSIDLIYIDPPYMSASNYHAKTVIESQGSKQTISRLAFEDTWNYDSENYLTHVYPRLKAMYKMLKDNGSIFVHLDFHISHYVKVLLDEIFTPEAFINEIVWCYSGGSGSRNHFHRKHDLILWYSKTDQYIFNPQYRPYSEATMQRGLTKVKGDRYKLKEQGALLNDWWTDIGKILSPTAYENLKFPTQKPIMLLERLVATASHPGGLVGDFYCGSGTTAQVCHQMGRKYIVCDNNPIAIQTCMQRMLRIKADPFFLFSALPETCNQLEIGPVQIVPHNEEYDRVDIILLNYKPAPVNQNENKLHFTAYIDFWEVGYENEQDTFVSIVQILRSNRSFDYSLPTVASLLMTANIPSLKVKVRDVFGSTAECDVL